MGEHSCFSTTELLLQAVNNVEKNQERELCEESIPVVGDRPSSSRILTNADIVRPGLKLNTRTINKRIRVVSTQTVLDKLRPTQSTSQNVFDPWNHLLTLDQDAPYRNIEFAHIHLFEKNQLKILLEMSKKNPFIFCGDDDYYMVYAGYLLKLKRSASYYVWKCVGGVAIGCNAVLRSVGDRLLTDSGHTHPPNFDGIETSVWNYYINDKVQVNISANSKISANFKISKTPVLVNHESRKKQAVAEKEIITLDEEQPTKSSKIDNEKLQSMILDAEDEIEMLIEGRAPKNPKANIEIKDVTSDFIGEASNSKQQENEENLPFLHESLANKIREFQETIIAEVKKAITAVEKNGFFYNLLENLERYAYKGYVYHLPEDDVWRCARRTKDSKLCSAKMKMIVRTTGAREVEILDEHDHQPDQVFILREVCRNILYRYISKNNIQQKYDEILTVLQGIAPDLLGGKILPRYGIAKRRVFDIKLSDEDVNRAQWLYEKNSQRSNTAEPPNKKQKLVVKNEEPDSDAEPAMDPIEETISEVMKKDPRRIKASIQIFPCLDESMYELEELDRPALNYDQIMEILSKPCLLFKNEFGCKNIGITLIEYATDPLFFTDGGEKKIAYRGDIYKLAHEDRDVLFWTCEFKDCRAELKHVVENNQYIFHHIGSHAHNLSNIYKIFELQVIKLETDDRQVEPTSFKFLQLRAMAATAEHIMASGIDPSILNFATVVQPKRVVPDEEMADAATPPTMAIQRQAVSRPHAIRPAFSLQVTSRQDFPRTIRMPIRLATPQAQIQAKGSMMEVPAEKDRWHVSIDYPIPFPLDESGLSRVAFCGFIYYKSHVDFNILYFKCERAHPDNPLYKCRGALTISQGKAQQTNPHDHRANFQRMWMELKNAGIDIAIYGLPKMIQAPRPVPARIPNSPNIIQTNEVTMNSSDDETSEVKSTDRNRTRMTIQPTCSATLAPTKPLQTLVDVLKDEVSRAFKASEKVPYAILSKNAQIQWVYKGFIYGKKNPFAEENTIQVPNEWFCSRPTPCRGRILLRVDPEDYKEAPVSFVKQKKSSNTVKNSENSNLDIDNVTEETNSDSRPENEASKKENEHHEKAAKKPNDEEGELGSEIFEVDQILDTKMKGRKRIFLVSWKGFPASENSWEPEDNLGGAREAVKTFMEEYNENVKKGQRKRKSTSVGPRAKNTVKHAHKRSSTKASLAIAMHLVFRQALFEPSRTNQDVYKALSELAPSQGGPSFKKLCQMLNCWRELSTNIYTEVDRYNSALCQSKEHDDNEKESDIPEEEEEDEPYTEGPSESDPEYKP